ncbi:hypothetical protein MAR_002444 [Mya arenaria]|uniref:Uncharacterized protein n=1 Tax=Mya arenaria TaxID=6604 RepID=A0ABY7FN09_MYAAR|nr:hypothetical protein MAR_002238 [Mya arenaria]WAR20606.1 hypothetical protein MAR_002444 [Mya arenaria]
MYTRPLEVRTMRGYIQAVADRRQYHSDQITNNDDLCFAQAREGWRAFTKMWHGRVLAKFEIHVLSKERFNEIIYEGPEGIVPIYLYHHNEHFNF